MAPGPGGAPVLLVFDPSRQVGTWTWRADADGGGGDWIACRPAASPPWRDAAGAAYDRASGRLLLFGGVVARGGGGVPVNDAWSWDGASWRELHAAHRPAGGPAVMAEAGGAPLLFEQDGTWAWRGGDWTRLQPAGRPAWRPYVPLAGVPAMDSGGPLALLVTGPVDRRTQTGSETWGWDGSSWRARDRRPPPP